MAQQAPLGGLVPEENQTNPTTGVQTPVQGGLPGNQPVTAAPAGALGAMQETDPASPAPAAPSAPLQGGGALAGGAGPSKPASQFDPSSLVADQGTPDKVIRDKWRYDPERMASNAEQITERLQRIRNGDDKVAKAQMEQFTDKMGPEQVEAATKELIATGTQEINFGVAAGQIPKTTGEKLKARLSRIYNVIPREEMGLFLIEFGMRALINSDSMMDNAAGFGDATLGALGSMQGRQRQKKEDEMAQSALAAEDAKYGTDVAMKEEELRMRGEQIGIQGRESEARIARGGAGGDAYQGEKFYVVERLRAANWPEDDINAVMLGGKTKPERVQSVWENLGKRILANPYDIDPITGKEYGQFNEKDMRAYTKRIVDEQDRLTAEYDAERRKKARGGALPSGDPTPYLNQAAVESGGIN